MAEAMALNAELGPARGTENPAVARLLKLHPAAYQLAVHLLGSPEGAEDVVQQAYLQALARIRAGSAPQEERSWFLRVVANAAKDWRKGETRRRRREAAVRDSGPSVDASRDELISALRRELWALDEEHRLPLALCYEQNLSQHEAAAVLDVPQRTISRRVEEGLDLLRKALAKAGYAAAPAAVLAGLAHTAPPVPATLAATLAAALAKLVAGQVAVKGAGAAVASTAAKGGMAMKVMAGVIAAGVLAGGATLLANSSTLNHPPSTPLAGPPAPAPSPQPPASSLPPAGTNPATGRQDREEVFEFAQKPKVTRGEGRGAGGETKYTIAFASKGKCDATVAIVGPDGKIVRHLASGVLGKNAPWPYKQDSLSQSVEWDGKDDAGKPVPAGCKVKVSLGLGAKYDKTMFWEPRQFFFAPTALGCGPDGTVYVADRGDPQHGSNQRMIALDRDGKYLRTVLPFPATMKPEQVAGLPTTTGFDGRVSPCPDSMFGEFGELYTSFWGRHIMAFTPDGKEFFLASGRWGEGGPRRYLIRMGIDGSVPHKRVSLNEADSPNRKYGAQITEGVIGQGDLHMAVSPDGRWIYFGPSVSDGRMTRGGDSVVCRAKLEDLYPASGKAPYPAVFLGERGKSGDDNAHFNKPSGVACDAAGKVYVSDTGNNRIQVFTSDGRYLRTMAVPKPGQLYVHPKSGAVYVLSGYDLEKPGKRSIVKLDKDGRKLAEAANLPDIELFALDAAAPEPILWVSCGRHYDMYGNTDLVRVVDRGDRLETGLSLRALLNKDHPEGLHVVGMGVDNFAVADPYRDHVYLYWLSPYDGRTGGKIRDDKVGFHHLAFGPDRMGYVRYAQIKYGDAGKIQWYNALGRFNPDDGKPVPFPAGKDMKKPHGLCIDLMTAPWCCFSQERHCVAPNGDIYVPAAEFKAEWLKQAGVGGDYRDSSKQWQCLLVFSPDGKLKRFDAFPFMQRGGGVGVGRNGNLYALLAARPWKQAQPDGVAPGSSFRDDIWGGLFCLDSAFDKFPVGRTHCKRSQRPDETAKRREYRLINTGDGMGDAPGDIEPVRWVYGGAAPVKMSGCTCMQPSMALDLFDRPFFPAMQTGSVNVLDANGNLIVRIGRYGNADSRGPDSPVIDPQTGLLRPKRADDPADLKPPRELAEGIGFNWVQYVSASDEALYATSYADGRVIRCALTYAAEETVPAP